MTRFLCAALAIIALATAEHPIRRDLVDSINSAPLGWTAHDVQNNPLASHSADTLRGMMGLRDYHPIIPKKVSTLGQLGPINVEAIPASFDARTKFASCQKPIRNQAKCGSCWAFGAAETLTDNLCVLGQTTPALSPQDLVSCDKTDHACHGGSLLNVWHYIDANGLVADSCIPYTSGDGSNSTCPLPGCTGNGQASVHKCPVKSTMLDSDAAIQAAVMTVGAVEVGFTVFEDFMNYKNGVYKYSQGMLLGGHAVKIVGWGNTLNATGANEFYWIVQNSWGPTWGEKGYFRIVSWHDDKDSAIGIGGGFACVEGAQPKPPGPPPAPPKCDDIVGYCQKQGYSDHAKCQKDSYIIPVCKKTCGCCDSVMKPSYCPK